MISEIISARRFGRPLAGTAARLAKKCRRQAGIPVVLHATHGEQNWRMFGFSRGHNVRHLAISPNGLARHPDTVISRISAMSAVLAKVIKASGVWLNALMENCAEPE